MQIHVGETVEIVDGWGEGLEGRVTASWETGFGYKFVTVETAEGPYAKRIQDVQITSVK